MNSATEMQNLIDFTESTQILDYVLSYFEKREQIPALEKWKLLVGENGYPG